jgi:Ca2+-binding EF-hand superfamily protein
MNLGGFIFHLFDDDKDGTLDFKEIKKIIAIIHAQDLGKNGRFSDKINAVC